MSLSVLPLGSSAFHSSSSLPVRVSGPVLCLRPNVLLISASHFGWTGPRPPRPCSPPSPLAVQLPARWRRRCLFVDLALTLSAALALITGAVQKEAPLKPMTFIKAVLRDRCLRRLWEGLLTERLNKQHSPRCDRRPDYNHLAAPAVSRPSPSAVSAPPQNILIVDEIHLYISIIVLNCSFEGVVGGGNQHLADTWWL